MIGTNVHGDGCVHIKAGDQAVNGAFICNGVDNRAEFNMGIAFKIHLCNQALGKAIPKNRKMNMCGPPAIGAIGPRVGAGENGSKMIRPICARETPPTAAKVVIKCGEIAIIDMAVSPARVGLPDLNQLTRDGASVFVQ